MGMEMFEAGAIVWRGHDVADSDGRKGGTHWCGRGPGARLTAPLPRAGRCPEEIDP